MIQRRAVITSPLLLAACGGGGELSHSSHDETFATNVTQTPSPPPQKASETDAWRPLYHYTPQRNWMNDPNGLVFFDSEYHLYYQYNPAGSQWGNISWGHAVSHDLVSWQELPVAIQASDRVMAFSGSVVVDHDNTAGFAPPGSRLPALVACFTGFDPVTLIQSQHLAYSLDRGRSYTAYAGNPVIDIGSTEFRDPKVFWHAATAKWVMLVVAALRQELWIYTSANLIDWVKVSTFGPAGSAANNIWEVPELFELAVDGDASHKRWVLVISVNHGALWGGSGVQYFIGDFDGTQFVADATDTDTANVLTPPPGDLVADFDGGTLPPGWHLSGSAFGSGPVAGALAGQQHVSGHLGRALMNSFHGGDASTGTLTSPAFTITRPWMSFQIAGGRNNLARLELLIDNQVVRQASGDDSEVLRWMSWDVSALVSKSAVVRAVDEATGSWGHVLIGHIVMTDAPVPQPELARITRWADHGRDFYAPITFANTADGRVLWLGWMSNWDYARALPTHPWRGQQSLPRQLDLSATPRGLCLRQRVADEVRALAADAPWLKLQAMPAQQAAEELDRAGMAARHAVARLSVARQGLDQPIGLALLIGEGAAAVRVGFDPQCNTYFIDRSTATPLFQGQSERHDAQRLCDGDMIDVEVWVDGCTVEVFADGGTVVLSDLVFPDPAANRMALFHGPENPTVLAFDLRAVRPAIHTGAS